MTITVTLTPEQEERLEAEVAAGRLKSVEVAVRAVVDLMLMPIDTNDLAWARPYLDVAKAQIERGEFVTHAEFKRDLAERIKTLGG
jgi:Arc/MetJ-type ribon-helix-helix transcriptional regulator